MSASKVSLTISLDPMYSPFTPEYLKEALQNEIEELEPYFSNFIEGDDGRVYYVNNSARVEDITICNSNSGIASITFESDANYGCKDINGWQQHEVDVDFDIDSNELSIDIELHPSWDSSDVY